MEITFERKEYSIDKEEKDDDKLISTEVKKEPEEQEKQEEKLEGRCSSLSEIEKLKKNLHGDSIKRISIPEKNPPEQEENPEISGNIIIVQENEIVSTDSKKDLLANQIEQIEIKELIPLSFKCKKSEHDTKYITLDKKKENLICKKCLNEGFLETNLENNEEFNPNDYNDNIKCLTSYCENKPYYFCKTCKDFICYYCLIKKDKNNTQSNIHYTHDIESINYESNSFKDDIITEIQTLDKLKVLINCIADSNKEKSVEIKERNNTNKNLVENYMKKSCDKLTDIIIKNNNLITDEYLNKFFENKDNEVKDLQTSTEQNVKKVKDILSDLQEIKNNINENDLTDEDKSELVYKQKNFFEECKTLLKNGNDLISSTNQNIKYIDDINTQKKYNDAIIYYNNFIKNNENTISQRIKSTSKAKKSYKLNRFISYKHENTKYFNSTIVEILCNRDATLYGLYLCGLHIPSKKLKEMDYSSLPFDERKKININIKILENGVNEPLINENKILLVIISNNDPLNEIFFEKSIEIKRDVKYEIIIENLDEEKYCDLWIGSVAKTLFGKNEHTVKSNNSESYFTFFREINKGSDFNEFEQGIVDGILFGV